MRKRVLVTSTDLMMIQFLVPHVINLSENGFDVEIACSDVGGRMDEIRQKLDRHVKKIHVVRLVRSPASPTNIKGYGDMKRVIDGGNYDIIWTNEPVMGVVTRLAARKSRKKGTKVIYMAHGFHFYKGAPKINWMVFYPVEWLVSWLCDEIVTINKEDYRRAKKMHADSVKYIHGIGVDTSRLRASENQSNIRKEIGISSDSFVLLSVGELLPRKNQQVIIKALGLVKDKDIQYILCGKGRQLNELKQLAKDEGVMEQVHFLGYRKDVLDIYGQADVLAFPSRREGLGLAGLEAMYCGLPLITSNTSGPRDYMRDGKTGYMYDPDDVAGFAKGIQMLKKNPEIRKSCGAFNRKAVIPFCIDNVKKEVVKLFKES
ncbi:MAG: glycosyltransferase family 4 protein [Lachnospiraceae bacterium]|nr:glycosyltransferase family 4 protein [Lachnospiraceae bacterium]